MIHLVSWLVQIGSALIRWTLLVCSGKVWLCGAEESRGTLPIRTRSSAIDMNEQVAACCVGSWTPVFERPASDVRGIEA